MLGTVNLPAFVLGAFLIVLVPGPNSMYVLSVAARKGVRTGYRAALGVVLGDTVLLSLTGLGAASLVAHSPGLFDVVKYVGAAYLAWLGFGMLRAAVRGLRSRAAARTAGETSSHPSPVAAPAVERPLRRALVVSLLNPKAILFDLAFLSQFVSPHAQHPVFAFALLSAIVQAFSISYLSALILGGNRLADRLRRRRRLTSSLTGAVGSVFLGFALKLATATLS